jgi:hypothetical protein
MRRSTIGETRGFNKKWISWVMSLVKGGSICIRIHDENSKYFKRQLQNQFSFEV